MDKKPCFKESAVLLNIWGFNPLNNSKFAIYMSRSVIIFCSIYTTEVCMGLFKNFDIKNLINSTAVFIGCWQCLIKILVMVVQRKKIAGLLRTIEKKYWKLEDCDSNSQAHVKKVFKMTRVFIVTAMLMYLACICLYMVEPEMIRERILPIPLYSFIIDNISIPMYIFGFVYEIVMLILLGAPIFMGFDFFLGSIIIYHINELYLIKKRFLLLADSDVEKTNLKMLRVLTNHQNVVLRCIQRTNEIYAKFFFNVFLTNVFTTCLCLISIVSEGFPPDYKNVARALVTLCVFLSTFFLYCYLGTLMATESENIGNSVYNCDWLKDNNIELRRNMTLIIQRSQTSTKLSAGPLMHFNLESFATIMGTAFNFFTLAEALFNK